MNLERLRKYRYPLLLAAALLLLAACLLGKASLARRASDVKEAALAASGDAAVIAVNPASGQIVVGDRAGCLIGMDANGDAVWSLTAENSILDIRFDGEKAIASADNRTVYALDSAGRELMRYTTSYRPILLAVNADGSRIAVGSSLSFSKNRVDVIDAAGQRLAQWSVLTTLKALFYNADGELLAVSNDGSIVVYDSAGTVLRQAQLDYNPLFLAFDRQRRTLIVADAANNCIALDETLTEQWRQTFAKPILAVGLDESTGETIAVVTGGDLILIGANGKTVAAAKVRDDVVRLAADSRGDRLYLLYKGGMDVYGLSALRSAASVRAALNWLGWLTIPCALFAAVSLLNVFPRARRAVWGRTRNTLRAIRRHRKSYLMLLPTLALLIVFCYVPIFSGLFIAFTEYVPGVSQKFVGFANFQSMIHNNYFWTGVGNMLILLVTDLVKALVPSVLFAELIIAMRSKRAQYTTRVLLYLPAIMPGVASLLIWTTGILGMDGLVNGFLRLIGLGQYAMSWLGNGQTAIWALVFIGFPWIGAYLIIYGALISIPDSIYDAAKIDGCGWFRSIISLDVPLIAPQLKYLFVVSFIASVQDFGRIYLTTGGGPGHATYTPMLELYFNMSKFQKYGEASAMGIFLFVVIFAVTVMNLRMKLKSDV